jgi:L-ascorbate metabolism protein UlaG (beta-lactamase superfamily)
MTVAYDGLRFDRPGHATVRIDDGDRVVYVDPWSDVLDGSPHDADVVLVTHDDFDHYDPDGIAAVATDDTAVAAYEAVDTSDLDREVVALPYEGTTTVGGVGVRSVPAHNRPDGDHVDDDGEPFHAEGEVVGLVLTFDDVDVYVASDTDFLDVHEGITADVFVPPIGGHYTMDRHEAADFAESVAPDLVLPVHYDTFDPIRTDAEAFVADCESRGLRAELF